MASPAADFATRYARGFTVGLVVILVIWHGGYDLVLGLAHLDEYRLWPVEVGAWVAMAVVVAAASARALRGTAAGRSGSWLLAGVTLAAGVAATLACPSEALIDADWAWGGMGWVAVLVLHRRPLREFVAT
ncbi:MAG: hypothetical protein ACJ73E_05875, partial [Mycobacteriales bacterium]